MKPVRLRYASDLSDAAVLAGRCWRADARQPQGNAPGQS